MYCTVLAGGSHHKGSGSAAEASVSARTAHRSRPPPPQHHSRRRAGGPAGRPGRLGPPPRLLPHHQRLRRVQAAVDPAEPPRAPAQARQSSHSVRLRSHHGRLRVGRVNTVLIKRQKTVHKIPQIFILFYILRIFIILIIETPHW